MFCPETRQGRRPRRSQGRTADGFGVALDMELLLARQAKWIAALFIP